MSVAEMKEEIMAKVEGLNESQLKIAEQFIEKINSLEGDAWDLKKYVDDIINERANVLQKLAQ